MSTKIVFLFGPQLVSFTADHYAHLLSTYPNIPWFRKVVLKTVKELPQWWKSISIALPHLQALPGERLLHSWYQDLSSGGPFRLTFPLPSIVLTPMVVVIQLLQYLKRRHSAAQWSNLRDGSEILGFCTGLLSGFALAGSETQEQFDKHAAVAIRLAMLIGALVDVLETPENLEKSTSYSITWNDSQTYKDIEAVLCEFPHGAAYLSVIFDRKRATLVTSQSCAVALVNKLKGFGIGVSELGHRGRFHSQHHAKYIHDIHKFCDSNVEFQFPDASQQIVTIRSNTNTGFITRGSLHHIAIESILLHRCYWYQAVSCLASQLRGDNYSIIVLGSERCLPPSLLSEMGPVIHALNIEPPQNPEQREKIREISDTDIAVIGMACKLPGADDMEEFWQLLCKGDSQHQEVPEERMVFESCYREADQKRTWFGNFIRDYEAFDHKFFKKSPREAAAMDPQQRLMLQTAYQAVAHAGYFSSNNSSNLERKVGCYIGVSNVDYEANIACYSPSAYSATGILKSFVAGKVSYYFGWTGPSLTVDTACSGSAVALHQACQGILTGDCTEALAGGVNILLSPLWYQNLAGASFLSPTGPCRPFDAKADGYCRGEGCGAVYLKNARAAIADGNQIHGIIAATAVQQNESCTPITVPNDRSLSGLFRNVLCRANIAPSQVSVVEAHGTGTVVGDPAEYDSIRRVLGGPMRLEPGPLVLGSVKSLVGHLECASGIVALLKILLMLKKEVIPSQVGFESINPVIGASPGDKMQILTSMKPWNSNFKAALINNYGASGSNASVIVMEAPKPESVLLRGHSSAGPLKTIPFWFSCLDQAGIQAYCAAFLAFIRAKPVPPPLADLSFNLFTQTDRSLASNLIFSCTTLNELTERLTPCQNRDNFTTNLRSENPVILCFGGQVSTSIGLNPELFQSVVVLRHYLDECNTACQSLGLEGIYPEIFQRTPILDTVKLQLALFAIQYACGKTWIACKVKVAAMIGHSFGELTSLCIAGVLSLNDTIRLVASRAQLVRDSWGEDKGIMIAVEADLSQVEILLSHCNQQQYKAGAASIACVNGPRSFTLAGPVRVMTLVQDVLKADARFASVRTKTLSINNAFHSTLVEPLMAELERVGKGLIFNPPSIDVEVSTELPSKAPSGGAYVAEHMRYPVYFNNAVQRLAKKYPAATWLEAGSNSTVTTMAERALGNTSSSHFQAVNLTSGNSSFVDMFIALWSRGHDITYWPHHRQQSAAYEQLLLPPYQFEKTQHMLVMKAPIKFNTSSPGEAHSEDTLWSFLGYQDSKQQRARFLIHTKSKRFEEYIAGHTVAQSAPLCPSTLQLELAIEAIQSIHPEYAEQRLQPQLQGLDNHSPICLDSTQTVWLEAEVQPPQDHLWKWKMISQSTVAGPKEASVAKLHVTGELFFCSTEDPMFQAEISRLERLIDHQQCLSLLSDADADDIIQGRQIYKSFSEVVDYSCMYQGVRKVVGKANRSAGRVIKPYTRDTWLECALCDSFCQVAGIFVNCMSDMPKQEICISNRIERLIRSPHYHMRCAPNTYDVLAIHSHLSEKAFLSDVFIFDPRNGRLLQVILGIQYQKVNKSAFGRLMQKLTPIQTGRDDPDKRPCLKKPDSKELTPVNIKLTPPPTDMIGRTLELLEGVSGIDKKEIYEHTCLADIGIDSLMGMELARDIERAFNCSLDLTHLMELTDVSSLMKCLYAALGLGESGGWTSQDEMNGSTDETIETPVTQLEEPGDVEVETKNKNTATRTFDTEVDDCQTAIDEYIHTFSEGFLAPVRQAVSGTLKETEQVVVLVTGATGSLGSHLVAHLASQSAIQRVICLNRHSGGDPQQRQHQAFELRGIALKAKAHAKLKIIETDSSVPGLGIGALEYQQLALTVTHIVHNAWPMTIKRPMQKFEAQFQTMRNLIDLARDAANNRPRSFKFRFQFISSIGTVGNHPIRPGKAIVPEERTMASSALSSGYCYAKVVCEGMLEATLQRYPESFNAMTVRLGQISGSSLSGYWDTAEHLSLLFKSSQTIHALPNLQGELSWCPVDHAAIVLGDILLHPGPSYHVYHVENPTRQPWPDAIRMVAQELDIAPENIIPFEEWLDRIRKWSDLAENPAMRIDAFLREHFIHMACGGLILDTTKAQKISAKLRGMSTISPESIRKHVQYWRQTGFLLHGSYP